MFRLVAGRLHHCRGLSVVVVYGHSFGYVKSVLWLVAFLLSFGISVLCVEPLKALAVAAFLTVCTKRTAYENTIGAEPHDSRLGSVVSVSDQWARYRQMYAAFRQRPIAIQTASSPPLSSELRRPLDDDPVRMRRREKYLLYYSTLTADLAMFSLYLVTLLLVVLGTRDDLSYYSTRLANDYVVRGRYVRGPHCPCLNETDFWAYLGDVLVPTIHPDGPLQNTGWLRGRTTKLIGVGRLRQQRVRTFCDVRRNVSQMQHAARRTDCSRHFDAAAQERRRFGSGWSAYVADRPYRTQFVRLTEPWVYQSAWQSESMAVFGTDRLYEGGGYVMRLGRTGSNSRAILRYARRSGWLDRRTVVVFVELTLYTAQANLFNVITLIAERTPLGSYRLSSSVQTVRLLLVLQTLSAATLVLAIAFAGCTVAFAVRLLVGLRVRRDCGPWDVLDTLLVLLSVGALWLFGARDRYVGRLLGRLAEARNNAYVSFAYAAFGDRLLTGWCSVLITVATVRMWRVLQCVRVFRVITRTLRRAAPSLLWTAAFTAVLLVALALAVRLLNGGWAADRRFGTLGGTVAALAVLAFGFADERIGAGDLVADGGRTVVVGAVVLLVLTVAVNICLLNLFVTIVCEQFAETRASRGEAGDGDDEAPFSYWSWLADGCRGQVRRLRARRMVATADGEDELITVGVDAVGGGGAVARSMARMELINVQLQLMRETIKV